MVFILLFITLSLICLYSTHKAIADNNKTATIKKYLSKPTEADLLPKNIPNAPVDTKIPDSVAFLSLMFNMSIPPPIWNNAFPIPAIIHETIPKLLNAKAMATSVHPKAEHSAFLLTISAISKFLGVITGISNYNYKK